MENSKQIETCLSEISDNKDMILSLEKLQDSDNSATTIHPCRTAHRVEAQIKNISGKKSDQNELEVEAKLLQPDTDLMISSLNLPEIIGRREKLVWRFKQENTLLYGMYKTLKKQQDLCTIGICYFSYRDSLTTT